ncbi:hypothetical protein MVEN_02595200 [Mycena venus]|uniref:GED domain-containing protein n=1 Tax=Mycena venus TaxID=2733690 RepID=A0A8H6WR71_9AGAR|nr:hypothetical protein MVEN_02595200 [Mycena venus]
MSTPQSFSPDAQSSRSITLLPMDNHQSDHEVGLSDPSLSQGRRSMLDLVNRLHNTGAGKSSLIESISGITLPRAAGTYTRYARSDAAWKCIVELRFITDKNGQSLGQPRNEAFGDPIFDKAEVEDRIRRAQRAILNPSKPSRTFLEEDEDDTPKVSFSTNYISLQISGPEVADLSFVDLPGLIASVSRGGNERDIAIVESLVRSYISKPSCAILLTVACETDFENQGAHHLTKKHDPEGKRTIGVLTKPDRTSSFLSLVGSLKQYRLAEFLQAMKRAGYRSFATSRKHSKTTGITWEKARARENDFFTHTPPWSKLDPTYQKYLRTTNLIDRLSSILSDLISKRSNLKTLYRRLARDWSSSPKAPSNDPVGEVASLHQFIGELNNIIEGVYHPEGLLQAIRPPQDQFRCEIRHTAPDFRPVEEPVEFLMAHVEPFPDPTFLLNKDGEGPQEPHAGKTTPIFIDAVLKRANEARTRELSGHYPFVVQKSFIAEITAKILFQDHIIQRAEIAQSLIAKLIALENDGPMTLNAHYRLQVQVCSHYKSAREEKQNPILARAIASFKPDVAAVDQHGNRLFHTGIAQALSRLAGVGLSAVTAVDLVKLLPPDRFDPALNMIADAREYFQVAYKRIAVNIPLVIDHELVRGVRRDLLPTLYRGLGVNGPEGLRICRKLAQKSPSVAGKREELLKTASHELVRVGLQIKYNTRRAFASFRCP